MMDLVARFPSYLGLGRRALHTTDRSEQPNFKSYLRLASVISLTLSWLAIYRHHPPFSQSFVTQRTTYSCPDYIHTFVAPVPVSGTCLFYSKTST